MSKYPERVARSLGLETGGVGVGTCRRNAFLAWTTLVRPGRVRASQPEAGYLPGGVFALGGLIYHPRHASSHNHPFSFVLSASSDTS